VVVPVLYLRYGVSGRNAGTGAGTGEPMDR
jgi:hypothetical protein